MKPRRGLRARTVLLGLLALFLAVVGAFAYGYFQLVHYERRAALHLPPQVQFVARLDLEQVVLFEPFRRYVLGGLKRNLPDPAAWKRLEEETGVKLAMDLREVLFAQGREPSHWVIAVAGLFPKQGVLPSVQRWMEAERGQGGAAAQAPACRMEGPYLRCAALGLHALQAEDGVIVLGGEPSVLEQAARGSDRHEQLGLSPNTTALEVALDLTSGTPGDGAATAAMLAPASSKIARVNGRAVLDSDVRVELHLTPRPGVTAEQLQVSVSGVLQILQGFYALAGPDVGGERSLLATARVTTQSGADGDEVVVTSRWPREDIDRAAQALGDALWQWSRVAPAAPSGSP
jgi:hypothetical protein